MKYCPQCQKQYSETWITFCSDDGTILVDSGPTPSPQPPTSDRPPYAPPMPEPPIWRAADPNAPGGWIAPDERQPMSPPGVTPPWQPPPPPVYPRRQQSQGLALASMVLGLIGLFVGWICLGPIPGVVALILGFVALSQIKRAPDLNGGKPFAIVGIIAGSLNVLIYGALFILGILSNLFH
jgi:hypothetical protein